jgi:hypothetical protein
MLAIKGNEAKYGRNHKGEKVSSGVYNVLLYDAEGKEGEVTKILITR